MYINPKTIVTGASLVARLEALQQLWRKEADVWSKKPGWHANSVVERQIWSGCADALDPILAKLRRLQSQESKEEEAARVIRRGVQLTRTDRRRIERRWKKADKRAMRIAEHQAAAK
jgi:hypothetical protein